jgi:GT2 family glycosyltransferase
MVLSVIIVNHRVRYFLELCLFSVQRALAGIGPSEIIVVDNASADGSVEALRPLFPAVRFIENRENVGFARANNQALRLAGGEYILFLNPDTVLPEDFFTLCLEFMRSEPCSESHSELHSELRSKSRPAPGPEPRSEPFSQPRSQSSPESRSEPHESRPQGKAGSATRGIGALGVRMIDGGGRFLPESRRGFPTPWVAFAKLSGLSAMFPRSRVFAAYYLGHLAADRAHPAPVLSGACMLVRREILGEVGGFDERFFMYAEDIDLSYRIEQAGYVNYYFPGTTIVHFKGESTRKDIRYIRLFYKAMSQFRRKHFNRGLPALWNWGMELAIWVRAGLGSLGRLARGPGRVVGGGGTDQASEPDKRPVNEAEKRPAHEAGKDGEASAAGKGPGVEARSSRERRRRLWITGDTTEATLVGRLLSAAGGWEIVSAKQAASAVLLCEGPDFSFRKCISALEEDAAGQGHGRNPREQSDRIVLIHAAGSSSAVGSAHRDGQGESVVFPK